MKWTSILKFIGTGLAMKKALGQKKVFYQPHTYYIDPYSKSIKKVKSKSDIFILQNGSFEQQLDFDSTLGVLSRLIFAEASGECLNCKIAVGEVPRNRFLWSYNKPKVNKGKTIIETIVNYPREFQGVNHKRFKQISSYFYYSQNGRHYSETDDIAECILAASIVLYTKSDISDGALFFSQSKLSYNYTEFYELYCTDKNQKQCVHLFGNSTEKDYLINLKDKIKNFSL